MECEKPTDARRPRAMDLLSDALGRTTAFLVIVVTLIGAGNALLRYTGRFTGIALSSNAWIELQWYLFALIFLFGSTVALRDDAHVRVDVLFGRLSERRRAWIDLVGTLLFTVPVCILLIWSSWGSVRDSWAIWEGSPDPGGLPRWPIKTAVPVAFLLLLVQALVNVARLIETMFAGKTMSPRKDSAL
ncbi:MAG: TRAP transporter small permease subunit [Verrucomicrobia bacterium]|nr:TRAP transporter small permease subunit [Verrucomicrobiota bacterium]